MEWFIGAAGTLIGVITGGATVGIPLYLKLRKGMAEIKSDETVQIEGQFSRQLERLEAQNNRQEKQINKQEEEITALQREHLKCLQDGAKQAAEMKIMSFRMDQLAKMASTPAISVTTTITADLTGTITDADDNVKDVLGWRAAELIGQNVDTIIPRDIRGAHHAGLERVRLSGEVRPPNMAIQSYAQTKERERIPVIVSLNGWENENGVRFITAQIVHRRVFSVIDSVPLGDGSGHHLPLAQPPQVTETPSGTFKRPPSKHD